MKQHWPHVPGKTSLNGDTDAIEDAVTKVAEEATVVWRQSFIARTVKSLRRRRVSGGDQTVQTQSVGTLVQRSERSDSTASESLTLGERNWLSSLMQETSLGHFIRDLV